MSLDSISCTKGLCSICDLGNNSNTSFGQLFVKVLHIYSIWQEKINSHRVTVAILF